MGFFKSIGKWWDKNVYTPLKDGVEGIVSDVSDWIDDNIYTPLSDAGGAISDFVEDDVKPFIDEIGTGLENSWYKYTGQAHLTAEAQHAEELANTVNQRTAEDMTKAGLSKFGLSGVSAGSPNATNGLTLLDSISKAQQVKAQALALKAQSYDFKTSKKLGIRTGDKNAYAPLIALAKGLFGVDVDDIPDEGIIPYLVNMLKDGFGSSDGDGSTVGAFLDTDGSLLANAAKASWLSDPYVFARMKLPTDLKIKKKDVKNLPVAGSENESSKKALDIVGVNTDTSSVTPESNPSSYGVFSNDFKKDAKSFVQTMIDDKMVSTKTLDLLANQLSKRYNLSVDEVRKYLTDLVRELR